MNRQIKFKVWVPEKKKMFSFEEAIMTGVDLTSAEGVNYQSPLLSVAFVDQSGKLIAQQFTGLLDKNNKEIYEGDIVKYDLGEVEGLINKVVWDHFGWRISETNNSACFPLTSGLDYEIIGNIFENPELLS